MTTDIANPDLDVLAAANGKRRPELLEELAELLRLARAGLRVLAARLRGTYLEVDLSNGDTIYCERFAELWTPQGLARWVTQSTGVDAYGIKGAEAAKASAIIRQLAEITHERTIADIGRDHGLMFLELAPLETFTLNDQADRYRAFAKLDRLDPAADARYEAGLYNAAEGAAIARHSLALIDRATGWRLVKCGHLFSMVKALGEVASPAELSRRMVAAGWDRAGKSGAITATPTAPRSRRLVLRLWRIEPTWGEEPDDA